MELSHAVMACPAIPSLQVHIVLWNDCRGHEATVELDSLHPVVSEVCIYTHSTRGPFWPVLNSVQLPNFVFFADNIGILLNDLQVNIGPWS